MDWGTSHPKYKRLTVKKVKWSAQGLQYIEEWIDNNIQGDTHINTTVISSTATITHHHHYHTPQREIITPNA